LRSNLPRGGQQPEVDQIEVLSLAAAVEAGSSHPLALAIGGRAKDASAPVLSAQDTRAIPGKGVEAVIDGAKLWC
jgi:Cd2+/Zn2+-exporting ATPase